ncbi:MAG: 5-histidylcysteine sulfoxide synthase [Deltaproteobacteria bacterium]|nr:5-histidylcysteine sulfoxide synthase [Deltaproteobacteria bacterium]
MTKKGNLRTPILDGADVQQMRERIANYFNTTFDCYESLYETLALDEAFFKKAIPLRHPLIFYYGHTATFFVNKLLLVGLLKERVNPAFESMFAIGVDEMSWDDLNDEHYDWPTVSEVRAYRLQIKELLNGVIAQAPLSLPIDWKNPWWAILMGIEHEQIHIETSSVLIRQQELSLVRPREAWRPWTEQASAPKNELVPIPAGAIVLGKSHDERIYGWDNEYGYHGSEVAEFQASRYLVSNEEFLPFVEGGGYGDHERWEPEGRKWLNFTKAQHPTFWISCPEGWQLRLMTEVVTMPWGWPVEVNYHEAKAFCNWKAAQSGQSVRLPTEDEWYRLYEHTGVAELDSTQADANIHLDHGASPCAVNRFAHGELYDVVGNVWQWTETPIYPFEGFDVHPIYDDFTTPTYDGQHNLIKGGSWIACGNESRKAARYGFRRHFFQQAGFRYVVSEQPVSASDSHYETDKMLSEYAEFHYGDRYFEVPNFPQTLAQLAIRAMGDRPAGRALDLGCAVGRATFELARHFDHVTGIDFSARLIKLGVQLAQQGVIRYTIADEGELVLYKERNLQDLGLAPLVEKVAFMQGDACNLKPLYTGYDLVLAANLIDRLYDPALFLDALHQRINAGGLLLVASPYTWLQEHTERKRWIGGFKKDGESFSTLDGLKATLGPHFELIDGPLEVPFVIRETRRKFQHTLSEVTIWERKH